MRGVSASFNFFSLLRTIAAACTLGATIVWAQSGSVTGSPRVDAARLESLTIKDAEALFAERNRELAAARRAAVERNAGFNAGGFDYRN